MVLRVDFIDEMVVCELLARKFIFSDMVVSLVMLVGLLLLVFMLVDLVLMLLVCLFKVLF